MQTTLICNASSKYFICIHLIWQGSFIEWNWNFLSTAWMSVSDYQIGNLQMLINTVSMWWMELTCVLPCMYYCLKMRFVISMFLKITYKLHTVFLNFSLNELKFMSFSNSSGMWSACEKMSPTRLWHTINIKAAFRTWISVMPV